MLVALGLLALALPVAFAVFDAAVIASIVNLPLSGAVRFLLVAAAIWAFRSLNALNMIRENQDKLIHWTRLTFITLHLRNEQDDLPAAMERLRGDKKLEREDRNAEGFAMLVVFVVLPLVAVGVLLQFGVFGSVGEGWLTALWASARQGHP